MNKKTTPLSAAHLPPIDDAYEEDRRHREPTIEELLASIRRIISEESELLETAATSVNHPASRNAAPARPPSDFEDEGGGTDQRASQDADAPVFLDARAER